MKLYIASDHGGFRLKGEIKDFLKEQGHEVKDLGTDSEESCDYPDYAKKLCKEVLENGARGILICGTGIGMSIVANKFKGIRAAAAANCYMAKMSRLDNNSNVLCLGGRVIGEELAKEIVKVWLETDFSKEERHRRRVEKIELSS
jgi:ribose 5-phosphate isomerase B